VFAYSDGGMPVGVIARTLLVSVSYVSKVLSRREKTGETAARAQRCHLVPRLQEHAAHIKERVQAKPDMTLAELCAWLEDERHLKASLPLMAKAMGKLNLTLKKRPCTRPNRTAKMWRGNARPGGTRSPRST